jgi:hypothetical protein
VAQANSGGQLDQGDATRVGLRRMKPDSGRVARGVSFHLPHWRVTPVSGWWVAPGSCTKSILDYNISARLGNRSRNSAEHKLAEPTCAKEGQVGYIVASDEHLTRLGNFPGFRLYLSGVFLRSQENRKQVRRNSRFSQNPKIND